MERRERLSKVIKEKISEFILKKIESNPLLSITRVILTKDLRMAKVYITCLGQEKEELERLKKQAPSIRFYLAKEINLRYTPSLSFFIDG